MTGVTYLLYTEKKKPFLYEEEACFSRVNHDSRQLKATKIKYILNNPIDKRWVAFINKLKLIPRIRVSYLNNSYIGHYYKLTGYELFATLTLLRYIDEEPAIIRACLRPNKKFTPLQRFLLAHKHAVNTNHTISCECTEQQALDFKYIKPRSLPALILPIHRILHNTFIPYTYY